MKMEKKKIKIERLNHNGEGIGKIDGITTFVPKTIIGDEVVVGNIVKYKNYFRAEVLEYLKRGSDYVESRCKYYDKCGGCQLGNLSYDKQVLYKQARVKDIFLRYLGKEMDIPIMGSSLEYGYRNKITLQVEKGKLGLLGYKSNDLIQVDSCLLVSKRVNRIISELKKIRLDGITKIMIREAQEEILMLVMGNPQEDELLGITGVDTIIVNSKIIKGKGYVIENIGNYKFKVSPLAFFQVNKEMVSRLYDKVLEWSSLEKQDKVIDLYCGTGTIGIYLASRCSKVLGIEINKDATKNAMVNKKLNNIDNIEFINGDVGKIINGNYDADVIVVDPPRSGLSRKTVSSLLEIKAKRIVYVSCDTMTLVRDLKKLEEEYVIDKVMLVDMFPVTYHVECVCALELK